jgi:branched-chain amino acid transport system permease protein
VLSAGRSGLAGGLFAISHGFASLQEVYWTTSGKVVMMTVLGGIGTLWGSVLGATLVVQLEDYLASAGFDGIGIITGSIFCLIVLLFRRGIRATVAHRLRARSAGAPAPAPEPGVAPPSQPDVERSRAG